MKPAPARFKTGDIIRYASGVSALFRYTGTHNCDCLYGDHVLGGAHSAADGFFHGLMLADEQDLEFCRKQRPEWFAPPPSASLAEILQPEWFPETPRPSLAEILQRDLVVRGLPAPSLAVCEAIVARLLDGAMSDIVRDCRESARVYREQINHRGLKDGSGIAAIYERLADSIERAAQPPAAPVDIPDDVRATEDMTLAMNARQAAINEMMAAPVETDEAVAWADVASLSRSSAASEPVAFRYMTANGRWAFLDQSWEPTDPHIYDHLEPVYRAVPQRSAATEGEIDFNDPLTSRIMGAARLHTHDHTMAYNITRDVLAVLDEPQAAPVPADQVARTLALSYGRDPDALTEWTEMCDAHNRPVPIWKVYEEQAEALLASYSITRPHGGAAK